MFTSHFAFIIFYVVKINCEYVQETPLVSYCYLYQCIVSTTSCLFIHYKDIRCVNCANHLGKCLLHMYAAGTTQSSSYTCPPALSLCLGTYTTCSCTIPSGLLNRWSISIDLCAISINQAIQLKRTGDGCAAEYQQNGPFIRAWNEPKVNSQFSFWLGLV